MVRKIEIDFNEYEDLLEDRAWLMALEEAGVDNWEGYEYAAKIYNEMNEGKENN